MEHTRRSTLRLLGGGVAIALAGCTAPAPSGAVTATETMPLAVRSGRPRWHDGEDVVGFAALIDDEERATAASSQFSLPEERAAAVEAFLEATDFGTERLLLVETVGPNACYGEVSFSDVELDGETLTVSASATAGDADACAEVITYPSAVLRIAFEDGPVDDAAIEISDGWGKRTVVDASTESDVTALAPQSD
jgi:hypothetical protein